LFEDDVIATMKRLLVAEFEFGDALFYFHWWNQIIGTV